jgi:acyl carrier protein
VQIERMPLTASGEVDREELARVVRGVSAGTRAARPQTDVERRLAEIWKRLLAVPDVSAADNFFELGGDSLLAVRLLDHIRHECGVDLVVRAIFDTATLAELATVISQTAPRVEEPAPVRVEKPHDPQTLLDRLDNLAEDEVDILLKQWSDSRVVGG